MNKKITLLVMVLFGVLHSIFIQPIQANAQALTVEEIQEKGTFVIGTSADYPPFEFHAQIDGQDQIIGMDISFAQAIADEFGVELVVEDLGFDALFPALETGTVDAAIAGMSPTEERQKSVDFSEIYYTDEASIMVRAADAEKYTSIESLEGQIVGAQTGSIQEELALQVPNVDLYRLQDIPQLILALKTNKAEALVITNSTSQAYAANDPALHIFQDEFPEDNSEGMAVAFRPGSDEVIEVVNGVIAEAQEANMFDTWLQEVSQYVNIEGETEGEEQGFLAQYAPYFWEGIKTTIFISVLGVFFGTVLGIILALMRLSDVKLISGIATAYVEFLRGTPMLIQVMFIYFGLGYLVSISALTSGIIAVSLNSGAYVCEIIRSGLNSVAGGQAEASRSLGLSYPQTMRHVIFPQALKNIWPALGNEFVTIIKESSIVSTIGVAELTFQTNIVQSTSYKGILPLFVSMILYFILTYSLTKLLNYLEGRMEYN